MNTSVLFFRHGDIVYPTDAQGRRLIYGPEAPLSESGKRTVENLAVRLLREGHQMERIYTSPYKRAFETAQIIATIQKLPEPIVIDDFREIENTEMIGLLLDDFLQGKIPWQGTENYEKVTKRMEKGLRSIVEREEGHIVGAVGHGDPIRCLLFELLHPDTPLPTMKELFASDYIDKSEAWRLVLTPTFHLVEREYIGRPPEQFGMGERKS